MDKTLLKFAKKAASIGSGRHLFFQVSKRRTLKVNPVGFIELSEAILKQSELRSETIKPEYYWWSW